jgi:hypothetical protein
MDTTQKAKIRQANGISYMNWGLGRVVYSLGVGNRVI